MKITWIGHSCFRIEQDGYAVITDPYEDGYVPGLRPLRETADMVLCSHEHGDHNARDLVKISKNADCPFQITRIETFHDEVRGAKRGPNTIHILEAGGVKLAHFGDIGCDLEEDQIRQLQGLDVCLIPVGGFYTIDGSQAAELVRILQPKTVIPMHFRDDRVGFGFDVIAPVSVFAEQMESVCTLDADSVSTDAMPEAQVVILRPRDLA